jgi:RNA polymerase sigma factor (sigma-70 family)
MDLHLQSHGGRRKRGYAPFISTILRRICEEQEREKRGLSPFRGWRASAHAAQKRDGTEFPNASAPVPSSFRMGNDDLQQVAGMVVERSAALALYARQWLDAASADDVVQEALVALLAERHPPLDPIAWMFRAVRNAAIDHARAASRRRQREQFVAKERREWFEPTAHALIDAQLAEQKLRQIPLELRQVVIMKIWGELSFAQIGQIMRLSPSTVHERYASALQLMRNAMEKPCKTKTT